MFQCNVGGADRIIRMVLGAAIVAAGVYYGNWWGAVGVIIFLTGALKWCAVYALLGLSTCKTKGPVA